jgi:hypothetical protein
MSDYLVEIVRDDLAGFTDRVADEEAGASRFVQNRIGMLDGSLVNLATFSEMNDGDELLPEATFVPLGKVPAGKTASWTGIVLVKDRNVAVSMYR